MDWQRNRLAIMAVVAVALIGATWWALKSQTGDTEIGQAASPPPALPEVDRDAITELEIKRPEDSAPIRLVKTGDAWNVAAPITATAATTVVGTALDKIAELEIAGRAATGTRHHAELEVDAEHAVHVIARAGNRTLIDFWVGAFRGGNTMIRLEGQNDVLMAEGSIKFAFNKELREWRDRTITDLSVARAEHLTFTNEHGTFEFQKQGDAWTQVRAAGRGAPPAIEHLDPSKIETIVSSLTHLRAADFAAQGADPASLGLAPPVATVVMAYTMPTVVANAQAHAQAHASGRAHDHGPGVSDEQVEGADQADAVANAEPSRLIPPTHETLTVQVGNEVDGGNRYVKIEGNDTIFQVAAFVASRLLPDVAAFQESEAPAAGAAPEGMPAGMPMPGGPGGGPGGGQIPPDVMRQIQEQLRQRGGAGGH